MGGRNGARGTMQQNRPVPDYTGPELFVQLLSVKLQLEFASSSLDSLGVDYVSSRA